LKTDTLIPKILHQVWLGPKPLPDSLREYAHKWKKYHPEWQMILWTDSADVHGGNRGKPWDSVQAHPPIINRWIYSHAARWFGERPQWAARSDILRYELVARFGGVYSDLDFEPFESIEPYLNNVKLFNADEFGPCCGNYLFGAVANHPAMWTTVREMWVGVAPVRYELRGWRGLLNRIKAALQGKRLVPYKRFDDMMPKAEWKGILETTGPFYLARKIHSHPDCVVFPWQLFNPLPAPMDPKKVTNWPDHAAGNHHYAGTWYNREKINPPAAMMEVC
jgi:hypothetical protein